MSQVQAPFKFKAFYDRQLEFLAAKDFDGLVENQYTEDGSLLNYDTYVKGRDAVREHFREYVAGLGYIKLISTDKYVEGDDSLMFEATVETAHGIARVYDVFVLRDGKISHHFAGLLGFTPNAPANA